MLNNLLVTPLQFVKGIVVELVELVNDCCRCQAEGQHDDRQVLAHLGRSGDPGELVEVEGGLMTCSAKRELLYSNEDIPSATSK